MFITVYRGPHHKLYFLLWVTIKKKCEKHFTEGFWGKHGGHGNSNWSWERSTVKGWVLHSLSWVVACQFPFAVSWGLSQPVCRKPVGSVCGLQVQPFTSRNSYMKSIKHLYPHSSTASWLMPYQRMLQFGPWTFKWILK